MDICLDIIYRLMVTGGGVDCWVGLGNGRVLVGYMVGLWIVMVLLVVG
jgi:hypothetical protein